MTLLAQHELEHSLNVLSVSQDDSWDDIEKQYRQLIHQWHPDRNSGDDQEIAQHKFIELNTAFKKIRQHYRKHGAIPRRMPPEQNGPLLGTKKKISVAPSLMKSNLVLGSVFAFGIVAVFGAILWSLDSRLAKNNRDRAPASDEATVKVELIKPTIPEAFTRESIQQTSNEVDP